MTTENPKPGSGDALDLSSIQDQMSEEVNAVRNFAFIGVVVFLAGLIFLLAFDTSSIPLKYTLTPKLDLLAQAKKKYEREVKDRLRNKEKGTKRAIETSLEEVRAWAAAHNFGAFVGKGHEAAVVKTVVPGSAAERAGLSLGATIVQINSHPVTDSEAFYEALVALVAGESVVAKLSSGQSTKEVKYSEAIDFVALHHAVEHYAHNVEHEIEHHWQEELEPLEAYLQKREELEKKKKRDELLETSARLTLTVEGSDKPVFAVENALNVAKISYEASRERRLLLRDRKLNNAGTEFRHEYEEHQGLIELVLARFVRDESSGNIRLASSGDKQAGKTLGSKVIAATDPYFSFKVEKKAEIEFKSHGEFQALQKIEDERYRVYESFIAGRLERDFGTPQKPTINEFEGADEGKLLVGKQFYVRHCQHCHGVSGAGDGSTAPFLNPMPRIFTHGVFKFRSNTTPKPTIKDLMHVLQNGLYGSSMPNFKVFPVSDVDAVAHYVRFLAIRGEVEHRVYTQLIKSQELIIDDPDESPLEQLSEAYSDAKEAVYEGWLATNDATVTPEGEFVSFDDADEFAEAVAKGETLFRANCASCHGYDGQGGGEQSDGMYDSWGNPVEPRNLTRGIYRAGNRPIDLYWRISCGITGAGMPAFNNWPANDKWAVVAYVKNLAHKPDARKSK